MSNAATALLTAKEAKVLAQATIPGFTVTLEAVGTWESSDKDLVFADRGLPLDVRRGRFFITADGETCRAEPVRENTNPVRATIRPFLP